MTHNSFSQKTPSEIASELFQSTKVESAFDKKGKFSYLLARLAKNEFAKLYSLHTTVTIFIKGYWLQLCLHQKNKTILNRETNSLFQLELFVNEQGQTAMVLSYLGKKVGKFLFKKRGKDQLLYTTEGYYSLAKAAIAIFTKTQNSYHIPKKRFEYLPVLQIMPENHDHNFFNPHLVNLQ